jgi:hypothetical protein
MKALVLLDIDTESAQFEPATVGDLSLQARKMIENNSDWSAYETAEVVLAEASKEQDGRLIEQYVGRVRHGGQLARDMSFLLHSSEGGDYRWRSDQYTQAEARAAVEAYAVWPLACARTAR